MLKVFKKVFCLSVGSLIFGFGCAAFSPESGTSINRPPERHSAITYPEKSDHVKEQTPSALASLRLTEQASLLIDSKKPDEAIRTLEKSLNINPGNGRSYYFLAEAWILKGNKKQAIEFNRMAGIYLEKDTIWIRKVLDQKQRIENILKK